MENCGLWLEAFTFTWEFEDVSLGEGHVVSHKPVPSNLSEWSKSHSHIGAKSETEPYYSAPNPVPFDDFASWGESPDRGHRAHQPLHHIPFSSSTPTRWKQTIKALALRFLLVKAACLGSLTWHKNCQINGIRKFANQMVHYIG